MKKSLLIVSLLIICFIIWYKLSGSSKLDNFLPFLLTSDGWNQTERKINSENILVSGGGNEPGWNFQIRGSELNNSPKWFDLIADYGESEWSGVVARTSQKDYSQNFQFRGDLSQIIKNSTSTETSTITKSIIIYFESKECFDDAGNKHNFSAELNFNSEKEYTGCADIK
jgi:uncharacterized protein YxeA